MACHAYPPRERWVPDGVAYERTPCRAYPPRKRWVLDVLACRPQVRFYLSRRSIARSRGIERRLPQVPGIGLLEHAPRIVDSSSPMSCSLTPERNRAHSSRAAGGLADGSDWATLLSARSE